MTLRDQPSSRHQVPRNIVVLRTHCSVYVFYFCLTPVETQVICFPVGHYDVCYLCASLGKVVRKLPKVSLSFCEDKESFLCLYSSPSQSIHVRPSFPIK